MKLSQHIFDYIDQHSEEAFQLLLTLARIPAPSNHEEKRSEFCRDWLQKQGAEDVYIDEALNVILPIGCTEDNPLVVFAAHLDVVFPDMDELPLEIRDGRIWCPGVGDDTANVVAMLMAAKYIIENDIRPAQGGMLVVANAGEEGLGNLKGSRQIMKEYGSRITEFVSFDAWGSQVFSRSVGSKRFKIEVRTEGGHSYGDFGNRNAIHYLASLIDTLYTIKVPCRGKTTYNVGMIQGGTSVNTIAQQAEMLYEFRSDNGEDMLEMEKHLYAALELYRAKGIEVCAEIIGERPCMGAVDPDKQQALVERAAAALGTYFEVQPVFVSASTDCNIPLAEGIPSVAVGCLNGGGVHTREEYLEIDSLTPGMKVAFELMLYHYPELG